MSNLTDVANKLVSLCQEGRNHDAVIELYADDVVSAEAAQMGDMPREISGKEAVLAKGAGWAEAHEVHGAKVDGPFPHGEDRFAVIFDYDVTYRPEKQRMRLHEIGVYTVAGGKVVREEFYYPLPG